MAVKINPPPPALWSVAEKVAPKALWSVAEKVTPPPQLWSMTDKVTHLGAETQRERPSTPLLLCFLYGAQEPAGPVLGTWDLKCTFHPTLLLSPELLLIISGSDIKYIFSHDSSCILRNPYLNQRILF